MTGALDALCTALGIVWRYTDGTGQPAEAPPETRRALAAALGHPASTEDEAAARLAAVRSLGAQPPFHVVTAGHPASLPRGARLWLEDGTEGDPAAPVPLGLHRVALDEASGDAGNASLPWVPPRMVPLVAAPDRLPLPERAWGVTAPLYGLWEGAPEGLGDFALLGQAAEALGRQGAAFVGIQPIHAGFAQDPEAISPYSPSHRGRLDVRYLAMPGGADVHGAMRGQPSPLIDPWREIPARAAALRAFFAAACAEPDPAFVAWRAAESEGLERFARHEALAAYFGTRWPEWPEAYRDPDHPAVAAFAREHSEAVTFHAWAQWMAHVQVSGAQARARAAGMRFGLYLDLAVGSCPDGAETWSDPGLHAREVSLGAPPDAFAPQGQCWDLAPLNPVALLARGLHPFADILRAQLRYAGLLRVDHILGFARAFWVPPGLPGAYVMMPCAALLAVARLEAARAGATIVGEDLGVIPEGLRAELAASGVLGCRVMMFETEHGQFRPADRYPEPVLASFSTHDLPTLRGWCASRDTDWWERVGNLEPAAASLARRERAAQVTALEGAAGGIDAEAVHRFIAETPARLVGVQAEDLFECVEQSNLPGTIDAHPNWRRRLPVPVSAFDTDPRVVTTARQMAAASRG